MVGYDSMVPGLQLVVARFSSFLLRKLSQSRGMLIGLQVLCMPM